MSVSCSFVIPAFNESIRLPATLSAIATLSLVHGLQAEIIVVDDGSSDNTAVVARAFAAPQCAISVYSLPHRGKGFAIRHGVLASHGETVVLCDADLGEAVTQVLPLMEALATGSDIAIGSRWLNPSNLDYNQPLFRRACSRAFHLLVGHILSLPFKDTQCGLKTLTRKAADQVFPLLTLDGWSYDSEMIHVALALRLRIEEVSLQLAHDYRDSRFRPVSDGWAAVSEILRIRWNDMLGEYEAPHLERPLSPSLLIRALRAAFKPTLQPVPQADRHSAERELGLHRQREALGTASQTAEADSPASGEQLAA